MLEKTAAQPSANQHQQSMKTLTAGNRVNLRRQCPVHYGQTKDLSDLSYDLITLLRASQGHVAAS